MDTSRKDNMQRYDLLIAGRLRQTEYHKDIINPATEEIIARAPSASTADLYSAIKAAKCASQTWGSEPFESRAIYLSRIADVVDTNASELARLLTQEQGKPLAEALGEVSGMSAFFRYYAGLPEPREVIEDGVTDRIEVTYGPLGVVGSILPWNFPLMLLAFKTAPALLAGNTTVIKPAPTTPLATLAFGAMIRDVLPPGVLNIVSGENDLGAALTSHPDVRKVSFTGSTGTGRKVMVAAAETLKRLTLELGGNDAAVILANADVLAIAPLLFQAAFANAGQVCLAVKRLYVHDSQYDAMCDELVRLAEEAVVGDGLMQGTTIGPLQNKVQYDKILDLIEQSRIDGTILSGGPMEGQKGFFVRPVIVRDVHNGSRVVDEEQFGPILPVVRYSNIAEAIAAANASPYGLGASVWGQDLEEATAVAAQIDAGTVWVNRHLDVRPNIPFGGAKQSGVGHELGADSIKEYSQSKVLNISLSSFNKTY